MRTTLVLIAAIALVGLDAQAQSIGIQPLTPASETAAIREGSAPPAPVVNPMTGQRLVIGRINAPMTIRLARGTATAGHEPQGCPHIPCPEPLTLRDALSQLQALPFDVQIETPYSTVVNAVREAVRLGTAPALQSIATLNARGVTISVSPGAHLHDDVIMRVAIRRDGQLIPPTSAEVTPVMLTNALGASEPSARGAFRFDYAVFAPDQPITIVFIGRMGNHEWTMPPEELSLLK